MNFTGRIRKGRAPVLKAFSKLSFSQLWEDGVASYIYCCLCWAIRMYVYVCVKLKNGSLIQLCLLCKPLHKWGEVQCNTPGGFLFGLVSSWLFVLPFPAFFPSFQGIVFHEIYNPGFPDSLPPSFQAWPVYSYIVLHSIALLLPQLDLH